MNKHKSPLKYASMLLLVAMLAVPLMVPKNKLIAAASSFTDYFSTAWRLEETSAMNYSTSPSWYLNSGGRVTTINSRLQSIQGNLPANDRWRLAYAASNPRDTDNGYHPQNLLRLLTRTTWSNPEQKIYVKINKYNLSSSPERYNPNGILLFSRYVNSNNLYYAGLRVDGRLVVKKKVAGRYYTLAEKKYLPGTYDRNLNPNLIPTNKWIGLKTAVKNLPDGRVNIKIYLDQGWTNNWQLVLETNDNGQTFGPAIKSAGFGGLRTDFMDIEADQYSATEI